MEKVQIFVMRDEAEEEILKHLSALDPINPRTIKDIINYITGYC